MLIVSFTKASSFKGTKESRYGRRGHILSALSVPYPSVVDSSGCFLGREAIMRVFEAAGLPLSVDVGGGGGQTILAY